MCTGRWTQWIFLKLFERGLAYQAEVPVNWCPALGTVLANEEVIDGKSERGDHPVIRLPMKQWMLRITEYADRLLEDLDELDWSQSIKDMQRNWIGRSEVTTHALSIHNRSVTLSFQGAEITFLAKAVDNSETLKLNVFTTRPDTLFGATYLVLAPEHKCLTRLTSLDQKEAVAAYVQQATQKSDLERTDLQKDKSGVFTGLPMCVTRNVILSGVAVMRDLRGESCIERRDSDLGGRLRAGELWKWCHYGSPGARRSRF